MNKKLCIIACMLLAMHSIETFSWPTFSWPSFSFSKLPDYNGILAKQAVLVTAAIGVGSMAALGIYKLAKTWWNRHQRTTQIESERATLAAVSNVAKSSAASPPEDKEEKMITDVATDHDTPDHIEPTETHVSEDEVARRIAIARLAGKFSSDIIHTARQRVDYHAINTRLNILEDEKYNPFKNASDALYNNYQEQHTELDRLTTVFDTSTKTETNTTVQHYSIQPKGVVPAKYIIIKVVHGTFSDARSFGADQDKPLTKFLLTFAQHLAVAQQASVHVDSFQWSGTLNKTDRTIAGQALAEEIRQNKTENGPRWADKTTVWCIGHSHGCNVINNAAQALKDHGIVIDNAVFMASPVLDIDPLKTEDQRYNITSLLNIWGQLDMTGRAGTLQTTWTVSSLRKALSPHTNEYVRNVILQINGADLNHINIKYGVIRFLPAILQYANKHFKVHQNIILDIFNATHFEGGISPVTDEEITKEITRIQHPSDGSEEEKVATLKLHEGWEIVEQAPETKWYIEGAIEHDRCPFTHATTMHSYLTKTIQTYALHAQALTTLTSHHYRMRMVGGQTLGQRRYKLACAWNEIIDSKIMKDRTLLQDLLNLTPAATQDIEPTAATSQEEAARRITATEKDHDGGGGGSGK